MITKLSSVLQRIEEDNHQLSVPEHCTFFVRNKAEFFYNVTWSDQGQIEELRDEVHSQGRKME